MEVYMNEITVDMSLIDVNTGLNFGRFDNDGLLTDKYHIKLTFKEFIAAIEADYNTIRDEIKMDDETQHETSAFAIIDYGSITALLKNKQALQDITITYLDRILFSKLFTQTHKARYIINSTEKVAANNDQIEISGRSYRKKSET